jgi:small subunit ribosomal protein S1
MVDKFEELLEMSMSDEFNVGSTVKGKVVQINEEGIFVDIGRKSEAILQYGKVLPDDIPEINVGSEIEAKIIGIKDGTYYLSKKALDFERGWNQIKKDFDTQNVINVRILRGVNNGYLAEAYRVASGFIHEKNFSKKPEMGDFVEAVVSEFNQKNKKVVFTRKPIIISEKKKRIEEEYADLQVGMEMEGRVEKLSNFGAFIRITDHIVGLLHISEMSHDHIKAPSSICRIGDKLRVKVINIDHENGRVGLSHKETYTDPILDIVEGEDYDGTVDNLTDFGAFVRLPNSVVGLVHISEISYAKFEKLSDVLRHQQKVRVKVLNVNFRDRRVSLSIKALEQDPWEIVHERYALGERIDVTVKELNNAGMVVVVDDNYEGFIPIGEITHERIEHPSKVHSVGDVAKAQIINIDAVRRKIRLSIRQTLDRFAEEGAQYVRVADEDRRPTAVAMTLGDLMAKSGLISTLAEEEAPAEPVAVEVSQTGADAESSGEPLAETPQTVENVPDEGEDMKVDELSEEAVEAVEAVELPTDEVVAETDSSVSNEESAAKKTETGD